MATEAATNDAATTTDEAGTADAPETTNENPEVQETGEGSTETEAPAEDSTDDDKDEAADGLSSLPESWQNKVKGLRDDVAKYRTRAKAAEGERDQLRADLDKATSTEDVERIKAEADERVRVAELSAHRERILRERELPASASALLHGDTPEALEAAADALRDLVGTTRGTDSDPRGGLTPDRSGRKLTAAEAFEIANS